MTEYAVFLRGINISGKNKIAMPHLLSALEDAGFSDVKTYLNSGNITLSSEKADTAQIRRDIEKMLPEKFGFSVPVYVIKIAVLLQILENAPSWWGLPDTETYDNLIFILTDDTPSDICSALGEPTEELERINVYGSVIFWTFDRAKYQKCAWWHRTAQKGIAERLTIRTANTLRKMLK